MARSSLPFSLRRSTDTLTLSAITTTTETVHGLLRLEGDELTVQWRLGRKIDHMGSESYTDEEFEPVREATIPLSALAGATVRRPWWRFWSGPRIVLVALDLQVLDAVAGEEGLGLAHPAELVLPVRRADALAAAEFAAEVELAVAERELAAAAEPPPLLSDPDEDAPERPA